MAMQLPHQHHHESVAQTSPDSTMDFSVGRGGRRKCCLTSRGDHWISLSLQGKGRMLSIASGRWGPQFDKSMNSDPFGAPDACVTCSSSLDTGCYGHVKCVCNDSSGHLGSGICMMDTSQMSAASTNAQWDQWKATGQNHHFCFLFSFLVVWDQGYI